MSLAASTHPHCRGTHLSKRTLHLHLILSYKAHVITCTPPYLADDQMKTTYLLNPSLNLAEDRSTIHDKLHFMAAFLMDRVVAEPLRRVVGSTCEILRPEFDERGRRVMKHLLRTHPRRRITDGQTNPVRRAASADTFSCRLNWIWWHAHSPNPMRELQERQLNRDHRVSTMSRTWIRRRLQCIRFRRGPTAYCEDASHYQLHRGNLGWRQNRLIEKLSRKSMNGAQSRSFES